MMFAPLYLDYNASTPLDPRVLETMLPYLRERYGNASSRHEYGRHSRDAIDRARQQVAAAVGAHETEIVFTSGGSEANNLFIKGAAATFKQGVIAIGASEHPCVREPSRQLQRQGWSLVELPVTVSGHLDVPHAEAIIAMRRPAIVSQMLANNECGAVSDVSALSDGVKSVGGYLHCDAVQAFGKQSVAFRMLRVHAMTLSSHKIGGPIGAGALVLDKRVMLQPLVAGGGHERGLRSGTENVAAIVGFGKASELVTEELDARMRNMLAARNELESGLAILNARIFGGVEPRLPNTSYFAFDHIDGETLVSKLDRAGFAVASGAACSSANPEPSRTLLAMGIEPESARGAVRVSVGAQTSVNDVRRFIEALRETVTQLRQLAAVSA